MAHEIHMQDLSRSGCSAHYDSIEHFEVYEEYLAYYLDDQDITYQEEQLINQLELGLTSLARVGVMDKQCWRAAAELLRQRVPNSLAGSQTRGNTFRLW